MWRSRYEAAGEELRSAFIAGGHKPTVVRVPTVMLSATRPAAVSCVDCGYHPEISPGSDWYGGGQCSGRPPVICAKCRAASSESAWRFASAPVNTEDVPPEHRVKWFFGLFYMRMFRHSRTCPEWGYEQVSFSADSS